MPKLKSHILLPFSVLNESFNLAQDCLHFWHKFDSNISGIDSNFDWCIFFSETSKWNFTSWRFCLHLLSDWPCKELCSIFCIIPNLPFESMLNFRDLHSFKMGELGGIISNHHFWKLILLQLFWSNFELKRLLHICIGLWITLYCFILPG